RIMKSLLFAKSCLSPSATDRAPKTAGSERRDGFPNSIYRKPDAETALAATELCRFLQDRRRARACFSGGRTPRPSSPRTRIQIVSFRLRPRFGTGRRDFRYRFMPKKYWPTPSFRQKTEKKKSSERRAPLNPLASRHGCVLALAVASA